MVDGKYSVIGGSARDLYAPYKYEYHNIQFIDKNEIGKQVRQHVIATQSLQPTVLPAEVAEHARSEEMAREYELKRQKDEKEYRRRMMKNPETRAQYYKEIVKGTEYE